MIRFIEYDPLKFGLLIECENEAEIDELRAWQPFNEVARIYNAANPV
jgi:hypothetical protein